MLSVILHQSQQVASPVDSEAINFCKKLLYPITTIWKLFVHFLLGSRGGQSISVAIQRTGDLPDQPLKFLAYLLPLKNYSTSASGWKFSCGIIFRGLTGDLFISPKALQLSNRCLF
jgi:hypothetical protein